MYGKSKNRKTSRMEKDKMARKCGAPSSTASKMDGHRDKHGKV